MSDVTAKDFRQIFLINWVANHSRIDIEDLGFLRRAMMSLVESWSAIHCLAGRMLKEYVSKHSEYKGEEIDYDALVLQAKDQVFNGRFFNSEREFPLKVFEGKDNFEEGIEYHFNASVRQFIAAKMIYENDMRLAEKDFFGYEKEELFYQLGKDMIAKYSCAIQHTAACDVLKYFKKNLPKMRSENMRKAYEDKKYAERVVLVELIKKMLKKLRPRHGWPGAVGAAQDITKEILSLNEKGLLPIEVDEEKLFGKVSEIIDLDDAVIKVYLEGSRNTKDDPAARRRVKYPKW